MENNKSVILENVSVRYRKSDSRSTADIVKRLFRKNPLPSNEFWALRNISFSLDKGDMLGVIGRNGAGKSTMMKAISGTIPVASGSIRKEGRLCALLELGTGFDRDMTVKENIYLRGAFLGYSKEFIDSKYDEIIDYADMREFENNTFHTLSSGMKSRVAFSIASMVRPDIIILDEVFAVGDGDFRKKSQKTMQDIINDGGTTALMVSHSLESVRKQCNKVLWLNKGRMVMFGEPGEVCDAYAEFLKTKTLPDTESLRATEENPVNTFKKPKKKIFAEILVYLFLLLFTLGGVFFWSQFDLFQAYFEAKDTPAAEILSNVRETHDEAYDVLGVDTSLWDDAALDEYAALVASGDMSSTEASKHLLGSDADKLELLAARLEAGKRSNILKFEQRLDKMEKEYYAMPENDRPRSLFGYTYSNYRSLFAFEKNCDTEVQDTIDDIRSCLKSSGMPERLADELKTLYTEEKTDVIAYYMAVLKSK